MTNESQPTLEATAFHEAGHAVCSLRLGLPVKYVTIVPEGDGLGHTRGVVPPWFDPDKVSARMQFRIENDIVASFAGPIAETKATGAANPDGAAADRLAIASLALSAIGGEHERDAFLAWLEIRSAGMVEHQWFAIDAVARALLVEERLTRKRVTEVMGQALLETIAARRHPPTS